MSPGTTITLPDGKADDECRPFVKAGAKKQPQGLLERLMCMDEERQNMKRLIREWSPRLEFVVRLMLVATFLDDSFRMATHFSEHITQIGRQGCLQWLASSSTGFVDVMATILLTSGLLAQSIGSVCLLSLIQPDITTKVLICWTIAQPVLYVELSNIEFLVESISLIGGLLLLRAHLVPGAGAHTQLLGRLLIPMVYMYHAWGYLSEAFTLDETSSFVMYLSELSMFVITAAVLIGIVIGSALVAAGLKSRIAALLLALFNLACVFYQHPFFRYIKMEGWEFKVDEQNMHWNIALRNIALPHGYEPDDMSPWMIYNWHRYYFFLGLSTSGALLLLAQFGPGDIAVQKDEVLLPVVSIGEN